MTKLKSHIAMKEETKNRFEHLRLDVQQKLKNYMSQEKLLILLMDFFEKNKDLYISE